MLDFSFTKRSGWALVAGAIALGGVAACSILVQGGRCETDVDCAGQGPAAVCRESVCVATSFATDGPSVTEAGPVVGDCERNEECITRLGDFSICEKTKRTCVKLLSADCTKVHGDWQNDRSIYVGTMFRQGDTAGDLGASPDAIAAIELAFDEFANTRGGLPDPAGGTSRPLVAVECNQTQDPVRAAQHLSSDLRVPAIIGASSSYVTIQAATQATIQAGTFLMSPFASSPGLTTLDDKGLVWRTYPSDSLQAQAVPKLVNQILVDPGFVTPRSPRTTYRVGIVYKDDTYGQGLRDIILGKLAFNGKSASANLAEGNLETFSYPNTEDPANANYDFTEVSAKVIGEANAFDVVMILGTSEAVSVFRSLESNWAGEDLPYYILPDGIASAPKLNEAIGDIVQGGTTTSADLRKRIRGTIVNVFSGPLFDSFALKFSPGNAVNGSNAYDAAYVTAYALYATGSAPLVGSNLAASMAKLQGPAVTYNVGPNDQANVLQGLLSGNVALNGVAGKLDFDLATGDVKATGAAVWCLGQPQAGGDVRLVTDTGQTYDAATDTLSGTFPDGSGSDPCDFN